MIRKPTKIAIFFDSGTENPYMTLLVRGLCKIGYEVSYSSACSPRWLLNNRKIIDVLHFHWVQYFYYNDNAFLSTIWAIIFLIKLLIARIFGYKIVWTVHNIMPHEKAPGYGDIIARYALVLLAHDIIVHCGAAGDLFKERFKRKSHIHVIAHGHYMGWYKEADSRNAARTFLNIPEEDFVYLYFGTIKAYKGLEKLINVFKKLASGHLIIAGKPHNRNIETTLRQMAEDDSKISLHLHFVPDNQVYQFFSGVDAVVLPFTDVLSSGSAILALSFGKPVIAPALGCLPELITDQCGVLFDPYDPDGLQKSMMMIRFNCYNSDEIKLYMKNNFNWDDIAEFYEIPYRIL